MVIYGPYERLLRRGDAWSIWQECTAGLSVLGIEADGTNKVYPSLPTSIYNRGNVRDHSLRIIIEETEELQFNLGLVRAKELNTCGVSGKCTNLLNSVLGVQVKKILLLS